jgi:hypothetical protein
MRFAQQHSSVQLHPHGLAPLTAWRHGRRHTSTAVRPLVRLAAKRTTQQEVMQPSIHGPLCMRCTLHASRLLAAGMATHTLLTLRALHMMQAEQQQTAEAPKGDPRDRFTGYEPFDSEGNPWWEPPNRDVFEGGAWEVGHKEQSHCWVIQTVSMPTEPCRHAPVKGLTCMPHEACTLA